MEKRIHLSKLRFTLTKSQAHHDEHMREGTIYPMVDIPLHIKTTATNSGNPKNMEMISLHFGL